MKFPNVPSTSVKLMLFPFSLEGAARIWLDKEPPQSILTWDDLVSKFINKFFPPSKTTNLRNEITRFQQRFDESFYEAWDRFNDLLRACPHHGFSELHQLDTFYNALNTNDQDSLNSAAGGPQRKAPVREKDDLLASKFMEIFRNLHFELSFADALLHMPKFGPMFRKLLNDKDKIIELKKTPVNENCSAVILKKFPEKLGDPGRFFIPCGFPKMNECLALADLGASINLMPLSIWKELSLPALTKTRMILELADRTVSTPTGIAEDVFVKVGTFFFPADFVVVDYVADPRVPLILGRPFLRTAHALIDVHGEQMTLRHDDQSVTFKVGDTKTFSYNIIESVNRVDVIDIACEEYVQEVLEISESGNPTSTSDLTIDSRSPSFTPFGGSDFLMEEIDAFLEHDDSIPPGVDGIYDSEGDTVYLEELLSVINSDPNLPPSPVCEINVPEKVKSSCEDPPDLELKDLPSHLEYAFLEGDDKLPVIIAKNLKDEDKTALIKMLERLARNEYYCFLDGFSGYFQIPIDPLDQEKTTFTCPYGTFAYRLSFFSAERMFFKTSTLTFWDDPFLFKICGCPSKLARCVSGQQGTAVDILKDLPQLEHGGHTGAITPLKRSLIQVSIGPRSTRMPTTMSPDVTFVNVKAKFRNVMRCHKTLSKFAKSLTYGGIVLWGRYSRLREGKQIIYSWPLIIYQNGLKQKRSPPTTPSCLQIS
ncbi:reverse transcriptase domain-containing protein [Tanacetum coccineum]